MAIPIPIGVGDYQAANKAGLAATERMLRGEPADVSDLGIDFAKEWKLDRVFLELHTHEQLYKLPQCLAKLKPVELR